MRTGVGVTYRRWKNRLAAVFVHMITKKAVIATEKVERSLRLSVS